MPSQIFQHPDRPLTARDFERLLNLLVVRHQQLQRYQPINPYLQPYHQHQQHHNQFGFQPQQIPRPPLYNPYDPRLTGLIRPPLYGDFSDQDAAYQQPPASTTSASAGGGAERTVEIGQRLAHHRPPSQLQSTKPRPFYYTAAASERPAVEYPEATQSGQDVHQQQQQLNGEFLPADIREELLYRMLLLAMQPNQQQHNQQPSNIGDPTTSAEQLDGSAPEYAALGTTTTSKPLATSAKFRKPVRSVQILGEE